MCSCATQCSCPISIEDRKQKKSDHSLNLKLWFGDLMGMKGYLIEPMKPHCQPPSTHILFHPTSSNSALLPSNANPLSCNSEWSSKAARSLTACAQCASPQPPQTQLQIPEAHVSHFICILMFGCDLKTCLQILLVLSSDVVSTLWKMLRNAVKGVSLEP